MAILPGTGLLDDPNDPATYGNPNVGSGGLLGGALNNPLFNFGVGLLSTVGRSTDPGAVSGVGNIGKAFGYASQAQEKALQNELRRQAIKDKQQELLGQEQLKQYFTDHPEVLAENPALGAIAQYMPDKAASAIAAVYADPTLQNRVATQNATLAAAKSDNDNLYVNSAQGISAAEYLKGKPGGAVLLNNPVLASAIGAGNSLVSLFTKDPNAVYKAIPALKSVNAADIPAMLDAAQTVYATRDSLAASGGISGSLSNASPDVLISAFKQAKKRAETVASASKGFALPEVPIASWSGSGADANQAVANQPPPPPAAGGLPTPTVAAPTSFPAYSPQAGVTQSGPPTVYRDLPPAPAAAAAPAVPPPVVAGAPSGFSLGDTLRSARDALGFGPAAPTTGMPTPTVAPPAGAGTQAVNKVKPVVIDPSTGNQAKQYPRVADGKRATPKGQIFLYPGPNGEWRVWRND